MDEHAGNVSAATDTTGCSVLKLSVLIGVNAGQLRRPARNGEDWVRTQSGQRAGAAIMEYPGARGLEIGTRPGNLSEQGLPPSAVAA
jgi:hypothetical protein